METMIVPDCVVCKHTFCSSQLNVVMSWFCFTKEASYTGAWTRCCLRGFMFFSLNMIIYISTTAVRNRKTVIANGAPYSLGTIFSWQKSKIFFQLSTGFSRSLKVFKSFEICNYEFKTLKVLEFYLRSLKVLEFWVLIFFFMRPTSTHAYNMLCNTCVRTVTVANRMGWQSIAI